MITTLEKIIQNVLEKHSRQQTNLASESARKKITNEIAARLRGKFHMVSYASQRDFE